MNRSCIIGRRIAFHIRQCSTARGQGFELCPVPGPPSLPFVGNMFDIDMDEMATTNFRRLYNKYGPIFRFNVVGTDLIWVSDVDIAKEVLRDKSDDFTNGDAFRNVFGWFFPTSIIVVEGGRWQRIRRIMKRAVQGTRLSEVLGPMHKVMKRADEYKLQACDGKPCDVHRLASESTFDIFGHWAYNVDFNFLGGDSAELLDACDRIAGSLSFRLHRQPLPWLWNLPTPYNLSVRKAQEVILRHATGLVNAREGSVGANNRQSNLLDAMIIASQSEEEAQNRLTRQELTDNISTIFFGAYDTTSATLAFTMHFLAEHPEAQEKLAQELLSVNLGHLTRESLEALPYLDMVVKESNRLRSTAIGFPRTAKKDMQLGGYAVKKGSIIMVHHAALTARDPKLWGGQDDLDSFRPDRWSEMKPHRLASLPFGFGARMCIGSQLATMEHKFVTAYLVKTYSWEVDPKRPLELTMKLGLCPKNGCWLIPTRR